MCHNAIFPFYGALSTIPPNIWQYCTALHEHYAAQNPREVLRLSFSLQRPEAAGWPLASRLRRQGREAFIALGRSGRSPADPTGPPHLASFLPGRPARFFSLSLFLWPCSHVEPSSPGFCQHKNGTVHTNAKTRT